MTAEAGSSAVQGVEQMASCSSMLRGKQDRVGSWVEARFLGWGHDHSFNGRLHTLLSLRQAAWCAGICGSCIPEAVIVSPTPETGSRGRERGRPGPAARVSGSGLKP